jgi:hypothetical protein|tara:strand:+ start:390 stop:548 length:159 start_codon:yes stop_codon:yes gene_type:complete
MKNPTLVAKLSLIALALIVLIMFVSAVVIPNLVDEPSGSAMSDSVTAVGNKT